jgi:futalosine hydrolase
MSLLICVATPLEGALLRERISEWPDATLVCTGVGAVNAAHAVTLAIVRHRPEAIVVCGVGGAYPGSGLAVGDVVAAAAECYGDLGAAAPSGFLDMKALGFPVVAGAVPLYNELPFQLFPLEPRVKFVTVNTCTGTDAAARALEARTGGAVENMEGAAVAHVAHLHGVPAGEVRGISNLVTNRDIAAWRLREAGDAAQEALIAWLSRR